MEAALSIDTLLSAARLLDPRLAASLSLPSHQSISNIVPSQHLYTTDSQPNELRDLISGKMRMERKLCSASTSSQPYCISPPTRKPSTKHSRAAHNELEKTRRANLRQCLEKLKVLVPPVADAARNTTLALLTRARDHIKTLDDSNQELEFEKKELEAENAALLAELEQLREEAAARPLSRNSSRISRDSPIFLEYSPSTKPVQSPRPMILDPVAEGLLPAFPICYPRPPMYSYLDLSSPLPLSSYQGSLFLPYNLRV